MAALQTTKVSIRNMLTTLHQHLWVPYGLKICTNCKWHCVQDEGHVPFNCPGVLGVKRSMPNWAVLWECGQEPLQFYWFRAAAKFFNSLLSGNSGLLTKIVHADIALGASYRKCWTAEFIEACVGLRAADTHANCIKAATSLPLQDFRWICVSACVRHGGSWMVQILGHMLKNWLLIMHGWPCLSNQAMYGALPICCPGYLELELSRHVLRNIARFCLRAHTLSWANPQ